MANDNNNYQDDPKDPNLNKQEPREANSNMSLREKVLASLSENSASNNYHQPDHNQDHDLAEDSNTIENTRMTPVEPTRDLNLNQTEAEADLNHSWQTTEWQSSQTEPEVPTNIQVTRQVAHEQAEPSRQNESRRRKESRQKESSLVTKIVIMVILALVVMMTILGFSFYRYWQAGLKPLDPTNKKLVQVEIPLNTSNKGIGAILEKDKIIKSSLVFNYFVKTNNLTNFQAGYYQMSADMTLAEISQLLQQGGTDEPEALADAQITIPEGLSIDQIVATMAKKTDLPEADILKVIEDPDFFAELAKTYPDLLGSVAEAKDVRYRLEGYLFPATYNYYKDQSVKDIIKQMVNKTNDVMKSRYETLKEKKLTVQQVLTLASLVEKEGVKDDDRRNIAQVFFNRLAVDMPLQSDISILYAMDQHKVHLSTKDTQIDSPYNLYINKGFGPGPFNSPSEQAIDAVLNPTDNDYLYFLADVTTNEVYFAKDYEEHLRLKEKYIDNLQ